MTHARCFFALWPDEAERAATAAVSVMLPGGGRKIPAENLHATLLFMGEVSTAQFAAIHQAAASIVVPAFAVTLDQLEHWPRSQVLVLTSSEVPPAFTALAAQLAAVMQPFMSVRPSAPQQLHVTLARQVSTPTMAVLPNRIHWQARRFALVASTLGAAGSRYGVVAQWPLRS